MNKETVTEMDELKELTVQDDRASSMSLILNSKTMKSAMALADMMAGSDVTIPKHLQGSPGDCMAIVLQAMNWGMNPFVVAQKTHIVNGALGYEAQLVNAVVQSQGFITGSFQYEYTGKGEQMHCRVGAILRGTSKITWGQWLGMADVKVRNSPLWKTNIKQQLGYLQVKNWARSYTPGAILGVYTRDELEDAIPKDVTPPQSDEPDFITDEEFEINSEALQSAFLNGHKDGKTIEDFIRWAEQKGKLLTPDQKKIIASWEPIESEQETPDTSAGDEYFGDSEETEGGE